MFSISTHRNNILKITNSKIIAIKSYVSLKFSYKKIFILASNANVLYEICTTLMPSNMNITNINTHIQPQPSAIFMRTTGFYRVQYYNNLIYNVQLKWA
jgi:hypothetical protein